MMPISPPTQKSLPKQARSIERRQRILKAARDLVDENGSDLLRMADIGTKAEVPIGSVYQFFPTKMDVMHALYVQMVETMSADLQAGFAKISSLQDAVDGSAILIDAYYRRFALSKGARDIWGGMQSNPDLRRIDFEDSLMNANALFDAISKYVAPRKWESLQASCLLMTHLTGAAVSLCLSLKTQQSSELIKRYKENVARELSSFQGD